MSVTSIINRSALVKVPEITAYFWIIKVLSTTVGETFADYLNTTLGFGTQGTLFFMSACLVGALVWQFKLNSYFAPTYWLAVVLISVTGTLITDTMTDKLNISLITSTIVFGIALGTAAGDLFAEKIALGYFTSFLVFAGCIVVIAVAWRLQLINSVLAFWVTYVITRPLGASIGDFLSQPKNTSGIGLGTTTTSLIFLGAILILVTFLQVSKKDAPVSAH